MRDKRNWVIIALLLSMLGGVVYAIHEGDRLAAEKEEALADLQAARLEAEGWQRAVDDKDLELDLLNEKLEAAREVGSEPAVRGQVVTAEVPIQVPGEAIHLPCPEPSSSSDTPVATETALVPPSSTSPTLDSAGPLNLPPLFVSARTQIAVDLLADNRLSWVGSTEVRLRRGQDVTTTVLPIDQDGSALSIGERLRSVLEQPRAKRVAFGLRRPKFYRLGWSASLGVACHLSPSSLSFDDYYQEPLSKTADRCGVAASLGWGVQF